MFLRYTEALKPRIKPSYMYLEYKMNSSIETSSIISSISNEVEEFNHQFDIKSQILYVVIKTKADCLIDLRRADAYELHGIRPKCLVITSENNYRKCGHIIQQLQSYEEIDKRRALMPKTEKKRSLRSSRSSGGSESSEGSELSEEEDELPGQKPNTISINYYDVELEYKSPEEVPHESLSLTYRDVHMRRLHTDKPQIFDNILTEKGVYTYGFCYMSGGNRFIYNRELTKKVLLIRLDPMYKSLYNYNIIQCSDPLHGDRSVYDVNFHSLEKALSKWMTDAGRMRGTPCEIITIRSNRIRSLEYGRLLMKGNHVDGYKFIIFMPSEYKEFLDNNKNQVLIKFMKSSRDRLMNTHAVHNEVRKTLATEGGIMASLSYTKDISITEAIDQVKMIQDEEWFIPKPKPDIIAVYGYQEVNEVIARCRIIQSGKHRIKGDHQIEIIIDNHSEVLNRIEELNSEWYQRAKKILKTGNTVNAVLHSFISYGELLYNLTFKDDDADIGYYLCAGPRGCMPNVRIRSIVNNVKFKIIIHSKINDGENVEGYAVM